jgi:hypothetical protein
MKTIALALMASTMLLPFAANSTTIYNNDFNTENNGVAATNYTGFNGLTVTSGTVNLLQNGTNGYSCAGNTGGCVDMGATASLFNWLTSNTFNYLANTDYTFSFDSDLQRPSGDSRIIAGVLFPNPAVLNFFRIGFSPTSSIDILQGFTTNDSSATLNLFANQGFSTKYITFNAQNAGTAQFYLRSLNLPFANIDPTGVIVDNVSITTTAVPEPANWALLIAGFGLVGAAARRRRPVVAA